MRLHLRLLPPCLFFLVLAAPFGANAQVTAITPPPNNDPVVQDAYTGLSWADIPSPGGLLDLTANQVSQPATLSTFGWVASLNTINYGNHAPRRLAPAVSF
jgi:hypothetical protein